MFSPTVPMIPATASFEFSRSNTPSISRCSTFESTTSAIERVQQLCSHLSRTNTMASPTAQHKTSNANSKPTLKPAPSCCKFCKRPSECPACQTPLDGSQKDSDKINIDSEIKDTHNQLGPEPTNLPAQHASYHHDMPPDAIHRQAFSVFLAGSIEMGKAVKWQSRMASLLQHLPISVYNPRRGHWDPKATPEAKNKDFRHQVEWELNALEEASVICFFFDHDTMSPVTMCELGLWAASGKVVVCCNKQFWKSGNIHIVCERYGIPLVQEFGELQPLIVAMLGQKKMMLDSNGDLTEDPKKQDRSKLLGVDVLVEAGYKIPKKANA